MAKQYDVIDFRIQPEKDVKGNHRSGDRAVIIINGKEFLNIVNDGDYNYLPLYELYNWLNDSAQSNGEDEAYLVSCGYCDEAGCDSILVNVLCNKDSVVWKNFRPLEDEDNPFDLQYEFERSQYDDFMNRLRIAAYNYEKKRTDSRSICFNLERIGNVEGYLFSSTSIKLVNLSVNDIRQFLKSAKSLTIQVNFAKEATKEAVEKSGVLSDELKKSSRCIIIITSNKKATLSDLNVILKTISEFHQCEYIFSTIYDEEQEVFRIDTFLAEA